MNILEASCRPGRTPPTLFPFKDALDQIGFWNWPFWQKHKASKTIVIAGTNGKGSTCAVLETLLRATGARTGFFSSPHLIAYTERFKINGEDVSQNLFLNALDWVQSKISLNELTHFEVLTLMSIWIFCSGQEVPPVDYLILETGLGGLHDPTNAIPHDTAVITKISYDHEKILGPSLIDIARHKLGIARESTTVVHQPFSEATSQVVAAARTHSSARWVACKEGTVTETKPGHPPIFLAQTPWGMAPLNLPGQRGLENTLLALTTFEALGFDPRKFIDALKDVCWPGRMELVATTSRQTPVYVSGDHNPAGILSLVDLLEAYPRRELFIVCGVAQDKNFDALLAPLFSLPSSHLYLTEVPLRSRRLEQFGAWRSKAQGGFRNGEQAFIEIEKLAGPDDMILVTGSLFLAGAAKVHWQR